MKQRHQGPKQFGKQLAPLELTISSKRASRIRKRSEASYQLDKRKAGWKVQGHEREADYGSVQGVSVSDDEEFKPEPEALLTKLYYQAKTSDDLEALLVRAQASSFGVLEQRLLEDLATRRARGTWIATSRRPLPGSAYGNFR